METERDLEDFASRLPGLGFSPAGFPHRGAGDPLDEFSRGEVFVFSTAYDTALAAYLQARAAEVTHLFAAMPGKDPSGEPEVFLLRSFLAEGFFPARLILRDRSPRPAALPRPARGNLEILYTEVRP